MQDVQWILIWYLISEPTFREVVKETIAVIALLERTL